MPGPNVVVIDDEPDRLRYLSAELEPDLELYIAHPDDLTDDDLVDAHLVLVDYRLKEWHNRDVAPSLALRPINGLGLLAIVRGHVEERLRPSCPTAFAIHSAHLSDLSPVLPPEARAHAIARMNNLEWVFAKGLAPTMARQVKSLARAVQVLPTTWSMDVAERNRVLAQEVLALEQEPQWTVRAWEDVEDAHAPIHELSQETHGLALIRWLLHRILPYPSFLLNEQYLAARLRVSPSSLTEALSQRGDLWKSLSAYEYSGVLQDFLGTRWWKTGVETFLWDATGGRSFDSGAIRDLINERHGTALEPLGVVDPVVCLDRDLKYLPDLYELDDVVEIQPDDWPSYADRAWTPRVMAHQEPRLRALVLRGAVDDNTEQAST